MTKPHLRVTAAVIEKQGCYLAALRPQGEMNGGLWEFPGGKIKPGESPEQCLKREIEEELGIGIRVLELIGENQHEYETFHIELLAYGAVWISGELNPREHAALRWISPSEMDQIQWAPADLPIVERIRNRC